MQTSKRAARPVPAVEEVASHMGKSLLRAVSTLALAFLVLPLVACESKDVVVRIPDFDSAQVDGVWVWRLDDATGQWVKDGQIDFGQLLLAGGREQLEYENLGVAGGSAETQEGVALRADVLRDPLNPDQVTVELIYFRMSDPGEFRVTTYNDAGESPLSLESALL